MKCKFLKYFKKKEVGLTLVELMITAAILTLTLTGILMSYLMCLELAQMAKNSSKAVQGIRSKIEEIKNTDVSQIKSTFDQASFMINELNGKGKIYVDDSNSALLLINVSFSWRQPTGRVIGEDKDLDGQLDTGEDLNGNGQLDSIVQITTYILSG